MPQQETYERDDFSGERPFDGEVYECRFENCDFTESDLSGVAFVDCVFDGANLSMAKLNNTRLQGVRFADCKLMGVDFSVCSDFALSVEFADCMLDFASFWGKQIPRTRFADCSIKEVNFSECDLSRAVFEACDLSQAVFDRTDLTKADLRGARRFSIDPDQNTITRAKFARSELVGLLDKYDIDVE